MLERCKVGKDGLFLPDKWISYRLEDQGLYRIKLPVKRPPPLGPHAATFGEEDKWRLHKTFLASLDLPGEGAVATSDDTMSYGAYVKLVQEIAKSPPLGS